MSKSIKTEGVVLRSIRYGEADSILHFYTLDFGKVAGIARGVRRSRSRFGGRLEPCVHLNLMLHRGKGDLATVTGAETVVPHSRLRNSLRSLEVAAAACDAVGRLCDSSDPNPAVFHLLCKELELIDKAPDRADWANALAFRLKLMLAVGIAPQLASCVVCGESNELVGFSAAGGGVVCAGCESGAFPLNREAHSFMSTVLGYPLERWMEAHDSSLAQVERVVVETVAHHAHVKLKPSKPRLARSSGRNGEEPPVETLANTEK